MILRTLIIMLATMTLHAVSYEFEVGAFNPEFTGEIENAQSISSFDKDLGYEETFISYFGAEIRFFHDWIPDLKMGYINIKEWESSDLAETKVYVGQEYNGSITTHIDYKVFNLALYKTLHKDLSFNRGGKARNAGELFVELGVNVKYLDYRYDVKSNDIDQKDWITIDAFVPMPYIGVHYRYDNYSLFANGSALAFSDIKADSFRVGASIRLMKYLSINGGYMYEDIRATEKSDKVTFTSSGPFGSVMLHF